MQKKDRMSREALFYAPDRFDRLTETRNPWYESPEQVEQALDWAQRRAELMRWVRKQMGRRLSARERRCVELYYLDDFTYAQVAKELGCTASGACRAVHRSLRKLRAAAREDTSWQRFRRRR